MTDTVENSSGCGGTIGVGDPLYSPLVIEHSARPRNRGQLETPDRSAHANSPTCGDELHVTLKLADDRISELNFDGEGCALSQAAASIASEHYIGMRTDEVLALQENWLVEILGAAPSSARRGCVKLNLTAVQRALTS